MATLFEAALDVAGSPVHWLSHSPSSVPSLPSSLPSLPGTPGTAPASTQDTLDTFRSAHIRLQNTINEVSGIAHAVRDAVITAAASEAGGADGSHAADGSHGSHWSGRPVKYASANGLAGVDPCIPHCVGGAVNLGHLLRIGEFGDDRGASLRAFLIM